MKLTAQILMKDRSVKPIKTQSDSEFFLYGGGIYVIKPDLIRLNHLGEAELYYFENNPTPLNVAGEDHSRAYLDLFMKTNFIEQVSESWKSSGGLGELLHTITSNPQYLMILIMGAAILYSLFSGGSLA